MIHIEFKGEESARFARFATQIIEVFGPDCISVTFTGKEPLTSKYVDIKGKVHGALNSGYRRHVEIQEDYTDKIYWAAGTNATSSIATIKIIFTLNEEQKDTLLDYGIDKHWFIPTMTSEMGLTREWRFVDESIKSISLSNATKLLDMVNIQTERSLLREVALALRSYANFMSHNICLRTKCESIICNILKSVSEKNGFGDAKIALTELLGYVGSPRSVKILKELIDNSENIHVIWAAIIALGRIPADDILDILFSSAQKYSYAISTSATDRYAVSDNAWIEAAFLLCISRRVSGLSSLEEQLKYERYFSKYLLAENRVLHRYACLGLTQIDTISEDTIDVLITNISNIETVADKGYYAMSLLSTFKAVNRSQIWNNKRIKNIQLALEKISVNNQSILELEPDYIWGMENLADLSLAIENNELANKFHSALSTVFYDWRYSYYEAVSAYEKAEIAIAANRPFEYVISRFHSAQRLLQDIQEDNEYAMSIINFRSTIITARIQLLEILHKWAKTNDQNSIINLKEDLKNTVIGTYKQYLVGEGNQGISKREINCISNTVEILNIILSLLNLHAQILRCLKVNEEIENLLAKIKFNIHTLIDSSKFSLGHINILQHFYGLVENVLNEFEASKNYENILRLLFEISEYANSISWTMPAHMCLLNGLGKGSISVVNENILGHGTAASPYILQKSDTTITLSTQLEVSTGASIQTRVICVSALESYKILNIVEGVAVCSFDFPKNLFSTTSVIPITFNLEFSTNDIIQNRKYVFYFRRKND